MAVTAAASRRPGPGAAGDVAGQSPSEAGIHQQVLSTARCRRVRDAHTRERSAGTFF